MFRHWAEDTGVAFGRWSHKVLRLSVDLRSPEPRRRMEARNKRA